MSSCKESTLLLKCGILSGDRQIGDFRFVSWFYGIQKGYVRQPYIRQTLTDRLKSVFPDIVEPFRVVFIDEDEDKIVLPADDIKETVIALQCFDYLSTVPIQIFIQLPDNSRPYEDEKTLKGERAAVKLNCPDDNSQKIVEKLDQLELTVHSLGQRIVTLLESLNELAKHSTKTTVPLEKSINSKILLNESVITEPATLMAESLAVSSNAREPSESSSSSFSVQSHSADDDWTRVGANKTGAVTRRRRFTTESSCASNHSTDLFTVQNILLSVTDGLMRSVDNEFYDTLGFCRNP